MLQNHTIDVPGLFFFLSTEFKYNPPQPCFCPRNSKTSVADAVQATLKRLWEHEAGFFHAVFGPLCSDPTAAVNDAVQAFGLFQMAPISRSARLSDGSRYPHLCRMSPSLKFVAEELKRDWEFVLGAVKRDGLALQFAAEELKRDRVFVLEAVKRNGLALQFAAAELQRDREVSREAVKQNDLSLRFVAKELKRDREFVFEARGLDDKELEAYVARFTTLPKAENDVVMDGEALEARVEWFRHVNANDFYWMEVCPQQFVRRDRCPFVQLVARDPGTPDARGAMNRAPGHWAGTVAATGQQELVDRTAPEHGIACRSLGHYALRVW